MRQRWPASSGTSATAKTKAGGTITFAFDAEADNDFQLIEPQAYCQAICVSWFQAIFDPLIVPNPKNYESADQFSGVLASSWSVNSNDTAYTFHLKPQAKFTNGQPVTATDVAYSFNRACEKSRLALSGFACSLIPEYQDTQIVNTHEVIIHMKAPDPNFLPDIAQGAYFGIVPASVIEKEGETAFGNDPSGQAKRTDQGESGRFRCFTREQIRAHHDNLDIAWLRDKEGAAERNLDAPEDLAAAITGHLRAALAEIEAVSEALEGLKTATDRGRDAAA